MCPKYARSPPVAQQAIGDLRGPRRQPFSASSAGTAGGSRRWPSASPASTRRTGNSHLGWVDEGTGNQNRSTREQVYDWIKQGGIAYVQVGNARADVITAVSPRGTKFVKTRADNTELDNLLKLPECR
jgi:hypothetical protein